MFESWYFFGREAHVLPRDATQSTQSMVLPWQVVCPSVCDVEVPWSHTFEYFKNNCTADETH